MLSKLKQPLSGHSQQWRHVPAPPGTEVSQPEQYSGALYYWGFGRGAGDQAGHGAGFFEVVKYIANLPETARSNDPAVLDLLIVGAGAAGLNAALAAKEKGMRVLVLKAKLAW